MHMISLSRYRTSILLLFITLLLASGLWAQSPPKKFVAKHKAFVDSLSSAYGIPSSIIFGISILESGSGTSRNARLLKNLFGIVGKNNLLRTHGIRSRYKQYATEADSFIDFCQLMKKKAFYSRLKGKKDPQEWVNAIAAAGYSVHPEHWKKHVMATIRSQKL